MSKIKALIVDDDTSAQRILEKYLIIGDCVDIIASVNDTKIALKAIEDEMPDVVFLDINMPHENGIDFARRLRDSSINVQVVFTTAYKEYAFNAFEIKPLAYLVKPFGLDDVFNVLSKVEKIIEEKEQSKKRKMIWGNEIPDKLKFKTTEGYCFLDPNEIFYAQADRGLITLCLCGCEDKKVNVTIKELMEMLEPYRFIKVNRSALINMKYIDSIDRKSHLCILKCGTRKEKFLMKREVLKELNDIDAISLG